MANTYEQFTNTGQTVFALPFSSNYLLKSHVKVYKGRDLLLETQTSTLSEGSDYTFSSATQITLATGLASGEELTIQRQTPKTSQLSPWNDGSNLTAEALNKADLQCLYVVQEQSDLNALNAVKAQSALTNSTNALNTANAALPKAGGSMSGPIAMGTNKITGLGDPTAAQDAVTKAYLERTGSITTTQIEDGTIVNADVSNTAEIDVSKLKDGTARQILQTDAAGSGVEWTNNVDVPGTLDVTGAVDFDSTLNVDGTATFATVDINSGAIDGTTIGANARAVGNFTNVNANGTITGDLTGNVTGNVTGNTTGNLTGNVTGNLTGDVTGDVTGDLTGNADTATDLAASTKITDTEQAAHTVNNTTYFTTKASDARYFNISSGDTIKDGQAFPDNDTTIATTAAINDRIIDLVDDVGGFVPVANETSFPTANPDVNNGAGTLISIKEFASSHTPSGGSVTIANGAGSGNTVTITGCGSTVLAAGFGGIVETTSTLHTYTFHRLSPKATEVSTVAGISTNVTTVGGIAGNVTTVAGIAGNVTTVAGITSNITTVAGIAGNVTTVAGISSDITAVANDATDIGAVAAKATEIGRLGTADAVADLNTLGTTAIVSDLDTCATSISNINNVGGSISNVNTVASNMSTVNDFAARYRVASSDPSSNNDEGDLCFNTTSNELRVYNGSAWQGGVTATGNLAGLGANQFSGNITFTGSQTVDGRDLSVDGAKLDGIEANATADQTDAEIRAAVESANDSNVFTDADHAKLNAIEANATADQTKADIEGLNITSVGTLSSLDVDGIVTFLGASNSASWIKSTNSLNFTDNAKAVFGTGSDLQIYHDGTHSHIINTTGDLRIDSDRLELRANGGEAYFTGTENGAVELYYDNTKRIETTNTGCSITGGLTVSGDLQINGTTTTVNSSTMTVTDKNIEIAKGAANDAAADGAGITVDSGDGDKTWNWVDATDAWTSSEHIHLGDNKKLLLGTGSDLEIYHDGSHSYVKDSGTGDLILKGTNNIWLQHGNGENSLKCTQDGAVELRFDNSAKLNTQSNGVYITGHCLVTENVKVNDSKKLIAGDGDDLQIYHNGSNSFIQDAGTGNLYVDFVSSINFRKYEPGAAMENVIVGNTDGAVELYFDNTKRIETTSTGANIVGALTVNGAALSSAPTITATASGTIAANDAVHLNSDGTVRKGALVAAALGSQGTVNSSGSYPKVAFNDAGDTICVVFKGSGNKPYAKAGTISGTTITWGGAVDISPNNDWRFETDAGLAANGSNWVFTWSTENSPWQNKWSMFTVDGTSITYVSTGGVTSDNSDNISLISAGTGTVIMSYNQGAHFRCIKGTISGTSITWANNMYVGTNLGDRFDIAYDAASQNALCVYVNSGIRAKVLNTGNMTVGSETLVISNGRYYAVTKAGNNIAVVGQVGYQGDLHARICTISGTSQTWGTEYDTGIAHQTNDMPACSYNEEVDQLVFAGWNGSDTVMYPLNIGGTNMRTVQSMGSALTVHDNETSAMVMIYDSVRKQDIIMWSGVGYKIRGPESSTYNSGNFIGFSSAGYTNGQTATINVVGNTTTQSSLTPAKKYYIQNDGTLGLTATAENIEAGIALTSTKLLIKG